MSGVFGLLQFLLADIFEFALSIHMYYVKFAKCISKHKYPLRDKEHTSIIYSVVLLVWLILLYVFVYIYNLYKVVYVLSVNVNFTVLPH